MTGNRNLVANFELIDYTISVSANPSQGGSVTGGGNTFHYGQSCTVTATPATGYHFLRWTENGTQASTNASYTFTVTGNRTLVAQFEINSYTINATVDPAGTGTITGAGSYTHGQECHLYADGGAAYRLVNWTENGNVVSTSTNFMFQVTGNRTLVAHLELKNFTVGVSSNPSNGGTVTGGGDGFHYNDECTLTAMPNPGYQFEKWTKGTQVFTSNPYNFTVTGNTNLQAHFIPETYTVSTSVEPANGGTATGGGSNLSYNSSCTLTATPATGYTFVYWTKDGVQVSTANPYTFQVTNNGTYVAHFTTANYVVSLNPNPDGSGTVSGGGGYNHGQSCTAVATANPGYNFVNWTQNGTVVAQSASYTFQVTGNTDLVANFQLEDYTVSVSANPSAGGTVSGGGTYNHGQSCTVTATPATGYQFVNWKENGNVVSTNANYTFTVTGNHTLVAHFQQINYSISVSANPEVGGDVSVSGSNFHYNQSCTVTATPATGYQFLRWTENGSQVSTNASYTFTVTGNRNLVAQFQQINYTINVSANPSQGGTVTGGGGNFHYGDQCTVIANPNAGYTFQRWMEDGNEVSTDASYTFTVTGNHILVAQFDAQTYNVSVVANPSVGGTVYIGDTPGTTQAFIIEGTTCEIHAVANVGYRFDHWSKNGTPVSGLSNYSFTVTEDVTFVAHFLRQFTIVVEADPEIGGQVTGGGTYSENDTITVTATANFGYTFNRWMENGQTVPGAGPNYTFVVTGDRRLVAEFVELDDNHFNINASAVPSNGGYVEGGGVYEQGEVCLLIAHPNPRWSFVNWAEITNEGEEIMTTSSTLEITVESNRTFVAHFQQIGYYIDVLPDPAEGGTVNGGGQFFAGLFITIHAIPTDGYSFKNWTKDDVVISVSPDYSFQVTGDATYVAHFEAIQQCAITVLAEPTDGGQVTGGGDFPLGVTCNLKATPNSGYKFDYWKKGSGIVGTEQDYSFIVTGDATYTACFSELPDKFYIINVEANPANGGRVSGGGQYPEYTLIELVAFANTGYRFKNWMENGEIQSLEASYIFEVTGNRNLIAVFEELPTFTITAMAGNHGTITPEGGVTVYKDADQTFTMTPEAGGRITNVLVDGIDIGPVESYTFRNVSRDHIIYVSFSGVGVEETQMTEVEIYPNPAKDKVHIEGEGIEKVALCDLLGNVLIDVDYGKGKELNVSKLSSGTYVLVLTTKNGNKKHTKLVVTK